ncbi:MAG: ABC transporter substrate-binding protein [Betaproteobacteria bacterium]|nr:ABC transporter substrate-binding protein [Betaproteobacteria bacterium]
MVLACLVALSSGQARADKTYGPGVTDTEIRVGNTMAYSGPASAIGAIGHTLTAYFTRLNEQGGIGGRKIRWISLDDSYSPPKTVEQTRRLVEEERVLFIAAPLGTPTNSATRKYLNAKKVPQLFLISAASKWNDPKHFPWSMSMTWGPDYYTEARMHVRYLLQEHPDARVGVLYQNDDGGKDLLHGLDDELAASGRHATAEVSFEVTDPTVDSQIVSLKQSGADALFIYSLTPKACAQAIRRAYEVGWRPVRFLFSGCLHPDAVLTPAGLDKSVGLIATGALKTLSEQSMSDPAIVEYLAFMKQYNPSGVPEDGYNLYGYALGKSIEEVLRRCGDDLTRENVMRVASSLKGFRNPMYRDGILIDTSPDDYATVQDAYMMRFDGKHWVQIGELLHGR